MKEYKTKLNGIEIDYSGFDLIQLQELKTSLVRSQQFELASEVRSLINVQEEIDSILNEINKNSPHTD